jgi:hypothetical protein
MPVIRKKPAFGESRDGLIQQLTTELNNDSDKPADANAPLIYEDYDGFSDRFAVRVVWHTWSGVSAADRVGIILEAYKKSKRSVDVERITSAIGLTPLEEQFRRIQLGIGGVDPQTARAFIDEVRRTD